MFCRECHRTKILFDSESKANNFIRFNADEIEECNGYAPKRSYYCIVCGGWHVTHKIANPQKVSVSEQRMSAYQESRQRLRQQRAELKRLKSEIRIRNRHHFDEIQEKLDVVDEHLQQGEIDSARETLREAYALLQEIWDNVCDTPQKKIFHKQLDAKASEIGMPAVPICPAPRSGQTGP